MEVQLIREYASRISEVFADKSFKAKSNGQPEGYSVYAEDRREFWDKVAQLPPDSEYWEFVKRYFSLMSDPKASKTRIRTLYKFLRESGL